MKKKKSPPAPHLVTRLKEEPRKVKTVQEAKRLIHSCLADVRFAGDIKQIAESYGLHYLKSKRMRVRELRQWIVDNHPAVKALEKECVVGVDWGKDGGTVMTVLETQPDGSLKIVDQKEVGDGG